MSQQTDRQTVFLRSEDVLPEDPVLRAAAVAYCSDMGLLEPAFSALGAAVHSRGGRIFSLTHSVIFHENADLTRWHQYDCRVESIAHGRALGHGEMFGPEGQHVASVGQLGLIRLPR